jgi:hypothetical protein
VKNPKESKEVKKYESIDSFKILEQNSDFSIITSIKKPEAAQHFIFFILRTLFNTFFCKDADETKTREHYFENRPKK